MVCALGASLLLLLGALPATAAAATFTVNTTADSSGIPGGEYCTGAVGIQCTLREAIDAANGNPGADAIKFTDVPTDAPPALEVSEASLPPIEEQVAIEGDTYPGATPGVPALELAPINMGIGSTTTGFSVHAGTGTRIEGFAIGGFTTGIEVGPTQGADVPVETQICGNYLGTDVLGEFPDPNGVGVEVFAPTAVERPELTEIGGSGCAANVIAGGSSFGIADRGRVTMIAGNSIGIGPQPNGQILPNGTTGKPGNESAGIYVNALASGTKIGGTAASGVEGNVIAHNDGVGIYVENAASVVTIRHNYIWENEGKGIEIAAGTPPAPPTIASAESPAANEFKVEGTVTGTEGETVELDFFGSPSCGNGEGQTFLGAAGVPVGAGPTSFSSVTPVEPPADDRAITATLTGEAGATSEFSACASYVPAPRIYTVTTTTDPEDTTCEPSSCTLRAAIEAASEFPNLDTIKFAAGGKGTIALGEAELPPLVEPVTIDGTSAPGWTAAAGPLVTIDGTATRSDGPTQGLVIGAAGAGSAITGIAIEHFARGVTVSGNHASFDFDRIAHNGALGVLVTNAGPETSIRRTTLLPTAASRSSSKPTTACRSPNSNPSSPARPRPR